MHSGRLLQPGLVVMDPSPFSALSADDLGCILRVALATDGSTMQSRCDLSRVCRRWRDSLRGAQPARAVDSVEYVTQLFCIVITA